MVIDRFQKDRRIVTLKVRWIEDSEASPLLGETASWRQFPGYAHVAARNVGAVSRYALVERSDGKPVILANCRTRRAAGGLLSSTLVSHGPVLLTELRQAELDKAIHALQAEICDRERGELVIDPFPILQENDLRICGGKNDGDAYRTILLDISGGEDDVRARFAGKWRTDLRRAEKEGLTVERVDDPDRFSEMAPLLKRLSAAKGFSIPQDVDFFARCAREAKGEERFSMIRIERDGELLSAHLGAYSGYCATYLLGATSEAGKPLRGAYLAQWAAIQAARSFGIERYDTGGIDPDANPAVHRFKKRMGGDDITCQPPVAFAAPGLRAPAMRLAKTVYGWIKRT